MLPFSFVHCAQAAENIDTISSVLRQLHVSPKSVNIWLIHQSTPSSLNFAQKLSTPVDLSVLDVRRKIAAELLEIAHGHSWTNRWTLGNHHHIQHQSFHGF